MGSYSDVTGNRKREANNVMEAKPVPQTDFGEYHPDGGWGWVVLAAATVVCTFCSGFHFAYGTLRMEIKIKFNTEDMLEAWLGSLGMGIALFVSPFVTIICRRKSPRLYAVIGALICALGCLFLAFSTQKEHLFISHCVVMSLGSGVSIVTANIMVGRYFRRRREFAEMILVAATGLGAAIMSTLFHQLISAIEWMHGLQCVAGLLVLAIVAGALYRSANLYHPRRKVILHLKSQKKNRRDREAEKPPYFDFSALRMTSLRAVMAITAVIGIGIHVPFVLLVHTAEHITEEKSRLFLLNVYLGLGFLVGCAGLGYITIKNSKECYISRRHLCQASALLCGILTLLLILANDESSLTLYAWAYGICCGSYYYSLKTYCYELVKSKLMERAWSFLCAAQSFPIIFGAPVASYLNEAYESQVAGYILAGVAMIIGGLLFYSMPLFERHPSNHIILQKHSSSQYNTNMNEAAALLDLDLSDGRLSPKSNASANNRLTPVKINKQSNSSSSSSGGKGENCGVNVQLQCIVQTKERDKPKQAVLTKICEEKDKLRNCSNSNGMTPNGLHKGGERMKNNCVELSVTKTDYSDDHAIEGPLDSTFSVSTDKSSSKERNSLAKAEGKKSKKNEVRIELFDPPSQEKESTATVSYDSDLYINLCEAQV